MGYDNILSQVGEFGLYQKLLCGFFVFYTTFLCGLNYYTQVFIFETPEHRCADEVLDYFQSGSQATWEEMLPWIPREKGYPSKCLMIDAQRDNNMFLNQTQSYFGNLNLQHLDPDRFTAIRRSVLSFVDSVPHKSCDSGWNYDHTQVFSTISSENNWVCEDDYRPLVIHTVFWVGNIVGCIFWGFTNDHLGRKPTVLLSHSMYFIAGASTLFAPNFLVLAIVRFFVGCAHHTVSHLPFLIVVEYCGISSRTVPLMMVMMSYTFASLTVPWVAMALPSWKFLAVIASTLILPVIACWK